MSKKLFCLMTLILLLEMCNRSLGVSLQVDVGGCGPLQDGWTLVSNCGTHTNVGGTPITVIIETGNPGACECRCESGSTHPLAAVETTFLKMDGSAGSPNSDFILTLRDLTPDAEYTLYTYHHNWEQIPNYIDNIIVTGATNVTKPSSIYQSPDFIPGEFIFTAGSGDVVIRYQCLSGGQPFFNGFELYGGGASIQFESASSGELETVTTSQIPVVINDPAPGQTYTVDYDVIGGTADGGGDDYTLAPGTLTFLPGSSTEYIIVDINDDDIDEEDETIVIELSNPAGPNVGLGSPTQHTYTIIDPRPTVEFERAGGSGMEDVAPAYVPVHLSAPATEMITVDYAVIGGTAEGNGVDYTLAPGTLVFNTSDTNATIPIDIIADSNNQEPIETIIIEMSNPDSAVLGAQTVYTHTIVSQPIDIQVDLVLTECDGVTIRPATAKSGWWPWTASRWWDMYSHDAVWEDGTSSKPTDSGIDGTGIHAALTLIREGDLGLKASGLSGALGGGQCPYGSVVHEPICNTWVQAVDWPIGEWGSVQLALHDLPAGEYALYSYHNNFSCYRGDGPGYTSVTCDCQCDSLPNMPFVRAMSAKQARELPYENSGSWSKLFPGVSWADGPWPEGVVSIQDACDVQIQQVTTDAELVPSLIRFTTDGSPVLILYKAGCCAPDPLRDDRDGGRGILNAFRLQLVGPILTAWGPSPDNGDTNVPPDVVLSWEPGENAASHDVYIGTDLNDVNDANSSSHPNVDYNNVGVATYDPGLLEFKQTYYWRVDEVNGPNLWQGPVWSFTVADYTASEPSPDDDAENVPQSVVLGWKPGQTATCHDVYFGSDWDCVNDANTTETLGAYKDRQNLDANSYDPCGLLKLDTTYYWRIDEVALPNIFKGSVWKFTTDNSLIIDDFESYDTTSNYITDTWINGSLGFAGNYTGSMLNLGLESSGDPVLNSEKSMNYLYNCDIVDWSTFQNCYYGEAELPFDNPQNWNQLGAKLLTLFFYGDPNNDVNDTEQMYVAVRDSNDNYAEVRYGDAGEDMNDLALEQWQQWNVPLSDFYDANQANTNYVTNLYIGFGHKDGTVPGGSGTVYFDDISLYASICIPAAPSADITDDCKVDFEDLDMMARHWLQDGDLVPDLYDDDTIDFKDFALLAESWLENNLWP